ncbi:hypothetical protein JMN32_14550 [Fulvivirga sp. 29W222]|uniref:Uncharacterized protein n=1 Tax=Fulvivirga marina TaxID=2494733 RepID=A0A937FWN5_9BACT|nr:hypothetical protein [Fulvivirga marina]MBL6447535.1 hypothetical protein [Fulvivirga marina]
MKKLLLTYVLFSLSFLYSLAQDEVLFKAKLIPNTTYKLVMSTSSVSTVNFEADQQILDQIAASGTTLPMEVKAEQNFATTIETGDTGESEKFQFTTIYDDAYALQSLNGTPVPTPESPLKGAKIYGQVSGDISLKVDSVTGNLAPEFESSVIQMTEQLIKNIKYPEKPMKVGDQFNQEVPMTVPMAGASPMQILIITTYKLKSITDNKAHFDLTQELKLNGDMEGGNMEAKGSGTGFSVYDIAHHFIVDTSSDLNMNLSVKSDQFTVKAKANVKTSQKTEISSR